MSSNIRVNSITPSVGSNVAIGTAGGTVVFQCDTNISGVVTATSFDGDLTGNVAGNVIGNTSGTAGGLTGSPSISVTDITASGNVSIAGILTYEDVTNIDSVGIITARAGVNVTGGSVGIGTDNPDVPLDVRGGGTVPAQFITTTGSSNGATIRIRKSDANLSVNDKIGAIQFAGDDGTDNYISEFAKIEATVDDATSNSEDGTLKFYTGTNGSSTEKFRITSAGSVGIGTDNPSQILDLSSNSNQTAIKLSNIGIGGIAWYVQSSGNAASNGQGNFSIYSGATNKYTLSITASDLIGISSTAPKTDVDISQKTGAVALPQGTTAQRPTGSAPYIRKNSTNNALEFYNGTEWVEIITDYFPTGSTILG